MVLKDVEVRDARIILDELNTGKWGYIFDQEDEDEIFNDYLSFSWEMYQQRSPGVIDQPELFPGYVTHDGISNYTNMIDV